MTKMYNCFIYILLNIMTENL